MQKDIFGNTITNTTWKVPKQVQQTTQLAQKKGGRGGILSSLISELGGAGGAVGGAAAGTAILPGIGTLIGAGLGGLLGGTGGRVVENKVRDDRYGIGDALKEGALSGVLGLGGEAFTAAKGAKAAGVGLREALNPETAQAVRAAGINAPGLLSKLSGNAKQDVVNPLVKASPFAAQEEKAITDTVNKYVGGLSAKGKYQNLDKAFRGLDKEIAGKLESVTGTTTADAVKKTITAGLEQDLRFVPGDKTYEAALNRVLSRVDSQAVDGKLSATDLFKVKQYLNSQIGKTFEQGSPAAVQQQVARIVRDGLDKEIGRVAEGVKPLTIAQSRLFDAAPGLQKASQKAAGIPLLGIKSKTAERGIQGAMSLGAAPVGVAGQALDSVAGRALKAQLLPRTLLSGNQKTEPQSPAGVPDNNNISPDSSMDIPSNDQQQSQYPLESALADIQRDPKNASTYLSIYNTSNKVATTPQLSTSMQSRSDALQTALSSLDSAETNLVSAGGAKGAIGNAATIPLLGQYLDAPGAAYHSTKIELATQLAKAITGGSRPSQQVIQQYLHSLPDVNDTPEFAAQKIAKLRNELQTQAKSFGLSQYINSGQ